jgi:hypothetical protein
MYKREININDKFGDYTIISKPYKINNVLFVDIQCKCGKQRKHRTGNILRLNKCKQCNAKDNYRKYDIGTKINNLTLIDYMPHKNNTRTKLKVQCGCGDIFYISSFEFNRTKCCRNCHIKKRGIEHASYKGTKNITKTYFSQIKLNAKKRNLHFNLNIKMLDALLVKQNYKCYISQQDISVHDHTASLDRIDSSKGYVKNNIAWIHKDIQRMKSDFPLMYFIDTCNKISKNNFYTSK